MSDETQEADTTVNEVLDDLAMQVGGLTKEKSILMAQVRRLSKHLEDMTKERDEALKSAREARMSSADDTAAKE